MQCIWLYLHLLLRCHVLVTCGHFDPQVGQVVECAAAVYACRSASACCKFRTQTYTVSRLHNTVGKQSFPGPGWSVHEQQKLISVLKLFQSVIEHFYLVR